LEQLEARASSRRNRAPRGEPPRLHASSSSARCPRRPNPPSTTSPRRFLRAAEGRDQGAASPRGKGPSKPPCLGVAGPVEKQPPTTSRTCPGVRRRTLARGPPRHPAGQARQRLRGRRARRGRSSVRAISWPLGKGTPRRARDPSRCSERATGLGVALSPLVRRREPLRGRPVGERARRLRARARPLRDRLAPVLDRQVTGACLAERVLLGQRARRRPSDSCRRKPACRSLIRPEDRRRASPPRAPGKSRRRPPRSPSEASPALTRFARMSAGGPFPRSWAPWPGTSAWPSLATGGVFRRGRHRARASLAYLQKGGFSRGPSERKGPPAHARRDHAHLRRHATRSRACSAPPRIGRDPADGPGSPSAQRQRGSRRGLHAPATFGTLNAPATTPRRAALRQASPEGRGRGVPTCPRFAPRPSWVKEPITSVDVERAVGNGPQGGARAALAVGRWQRCGSTPTRRRAASRRRLDSTARARSASVAWSASRRPCRRWFDVLGKAAGQRGHDLARGREPARARRVSAEAIHKGSPRREKALPRRRLRRHAAPAPRERASSSATSAAPFTGRAVSSRPRGRVSRRAAGRHPSFLDEIGELSIDLQPKLLRVLEPARGFAGSARTNHVPVNVRPHRRDEPQPARTGGGGTKFPLRSLLPPGRRRGEAPAAARSASWTCRCSSSTSCGNLGADRRADPGRRPPRRSSSRPWVTTTGRATSARLRNYLERCVALRDFAAPRLADTILGEPGRAPSTSAQPFCAEGAPRAG